MPKKKDYHKKTVRERLARDTTSYQVYSCYEYANARHWFDANCDSDAIRCQINAALSSDRARYYLYLLLGLKG